MLSSGFIYTFAGNGALTGGVDGGAATLASLNNPQDVAVNAAGEVFIAEAGNCKVRKVCALKIGRLQSIDNLMNR